MPFARGGKEEGERGGGDGGMAPPAVGPTRPSHNIAREQFLQCLWSRSSPMP